MAAYTRLLLVNSCVVALLPVAIQQHPAGPIVPVTAAHQVNRDRAALGEQLFSDARLSRSGSTLRDLPPARSWRHGRASARHDRPGRRTAAKHTDHLQCCPECVVQLGWRHGRARQTHGGCCRAADGHRVGRARGAAAQHIQVRAEVHRRLSRMMCPGRTSSTRSCRTNGR